MFTYSRRPQLQVLFGVAVVSVFVILLLRPGQPAQSLVTNWRPPPMLGSIEMTAPPGAQPPAVSGATVPLDALDVQLAAQLYTGQRDALNAEVAAAYSYVSERFGSPANARFTATFEREPGCGIHGLAYTDVRNMHVYTCEGIERQRAVNIMAHEIVHQLEHDRYGAAHLNSDLILSEGMATYGAGKYWLAGQPDFRSFVKNQRAAGVAYPLATHYSGLGVAAMNALYYQWASFVEYLLETYPRAQFDALYISGAGSPGSADYSGAYGKPLADLEREWVAWVDR
ncbi:MAG: hypothetical protein H7Z42_15640 [Roseiflexaceae bacterium]|nr:hypothetical protein [Roseiflexaceae bacterium]